MLWDVWSPVLAQALWPALGGLDRVSQAEVLFAFVGQYEEDPDKARGLVASPEALDVFVQDVWRDTQAAAPPHRPGRRRQEPPASPATPRFSPLDDAEPWPAYGWEDGIARVAQRVPGRVDRLRALGDSLVPQIAEWIGSQIVTWEREKAA